MDPEKEKSVTGYGGSTSLQCQSVNSGRLEWKWMIVFVYYSSQDPNLFF